MAGGRLCLHEAGSRIEQRGGIQAVETKRLGLAHRGRPKPPRPNHAAHRVRGRSDDAVWANHLDHALQRLGRITVAGERRRCELVVGADADVDAAGVVAQTHAGHLETVVFADPDAMVGDDVQPGFGEHRHLFCACRRRFDDGNDRLRWADGAPVDRPDHGLRLGEPADDECLSPGRTVNENVHARGGLCQRPGDDRPDAARRRVGVVRPCDTVVHDPGSSAHGHGVGNDRRLAGVRREMLAQQAAEFDSGKLGGSLGIQLSSASAGASSAAAAAGLRRAP